MIYDNTWTSTYGFYIYLLNSALPAGTLGGGSIIFTTAPHHYYYYNLYSFLTYNYLSSLQLQTLKTPPLFPHFHGKPLHFTQKLPSIRVNPLKTPPFYTAIIVPHFPHYFYAFLPPSATLHPRFQHLSGPLI